MSFEFHVFGFSACAGSGSFSFQNYPFPGRLISADPDAYLETARSGQAAAGPHTHGTGLGSPFLTTDQERSVRVKLCARTFAPYQNSIVRLGR